VSHEGLHYYAINFPESAQQGGEKELYVVGFRARQEKKKTGGDKNT
jgi:hypothetical protein